MDTYGVAGMTKLKRNGKERKACQYGVRELVVMIGERA
jgi:hypothetical protein